MHNVDATHIVNYLRQKKESLQQQLEDVRCGKESPPHCEQILQFAVIELQDILHHIENFDFVRQVWVD